MDERPKKNQYSAYALKSDDGKTKKTNILPMP